MVGLQHVGSLLVCRRPAPVMSLLSENARSRGPGGALPRVVVLLMFNLIKPSRTLEQFVRGTELDSGLVATRLNKVGPEMHV